MKARLNVFEQPIAAKAMKHIIAGAKELDASSLPKSTMELVSLRISQINGCAYCVDMHTKDAIAAGEDVTRLHLVAAWREATVFTDAERAALALAESATRIADGGIVSDAVWSDAAAHYSKDDLTALVVLIGFMNTVNRVNVTLQQPAGDYKPGQFG